MLRKAEEEVGVVPAAARYRDSSYRNSAILMILWVGFRVPPADSPAADSMRVLSGGRRREGSHQKAEKAAVAESYNRDPVDPPAEQNEQPAEQNKQPPAAQNEPPPAAQND